MRDALSESLIAAARRDDRLLVITGDHGYTLFDRFRDEFPSRYLNAGIAEQNMVGMAAGMARAGLRPVVYGLSAFVPIRVLEQIKLDVAHDNLPVVFLGDGAGFVYSFLGTSHQSLEDIACSRVIPGLAILSPADRFEMTTCMDLATRSNGPTYVRIGKADLGDVHDSPIEFEFGDLLQIRGGSRDGFAFVATGSMVTTALRVADAEFPDSSVWSVPSIKPIDKGVVELLSRSHRAVVVLEEHSVLGGLGSLVTEIVAGTTFAPVLRIGSDDRFSHYCGSYAYLRREHEIDDDSVKRRICEFADRLPHP
jgi:transketolase